jgi:hypothetical protein
LNKGKRNSIDLPDTKKFIETENEEEKDILLGRKDYFDNLDSENGT